MKSASIVGGVLALLLLQPAAAEGAKPKSNLLARVNVLSKNQLSITIRHSKWGQKNAYQFASDHCAGFGKVAVQTTSNTGYGPDTTTTWVCQEVPSSIPTTTPSAAPE